MFGLSKSALPTPETAYLAAMSLCHCRPVTLCTVALCRRRFLPVANDYWSGWEFLGAERMFWQLPGVYTTAVGYAGGFTANPTYEEVCSGGTGHTEVVFVVYDTERVELTEIPHVLAGA